MVRRCWIVMDFTFFGVNRVMRFGNISATVSFSARIPSPAPMPIAMETMLLHMECVI